MKPNLLRPAKLVAFGLAALLLASGAGLAHLDPPGLVMSQKVVVKKVEYAFNAGQGIPDTAGIALGQLRVTYEATVTEAGHGTTVTSWGLGGAKLPANSWARTDTIWDHKECTEMNDLSVGFVLHFRYNGPDDGVGPLPEPGAALYSSTSDTNVHGGAAAGFVETWDLNSGGMKIGEAKVTYDITIVRTTTRCQQ